MTSQTHPIDGKRQFMMQFVLNRAAVVDKISGEGSAQQALEAWEYIMRVTKEPTK